MPYEVVAIKCISIKRLKRKESKDNLITEIKLMKELKHRHIVKLIDFEVQYLWIMCIRYTSLFLHSQWDKNYIYLIMEYCEGGDLFHFIRRREHLPEDIARKFLQQLGKIKPSSQCLT